MGSGVLRSTESIAISVGSKYRMSVPRAILMRAIWILAAGWPGTVPAGPACLESGLASSLPRIAVGSRGGGFAPFPNRSIGGGFVQRLVLALGSMYCSNKRDGQCLVNETAPPEGEHCVCNCCMLFCGRDKQGLVAGRIALRSPYSEES